MEIIALVITGIIVAAAYMHGHKTGVKNGADAMYSHLYNQGIRKGDEVIVLAGKDKGKTGNVSSVLKANDRVVVEGVNIVKRHRKATQESPGKIEEKESSIHISNIAHIDPESGKATRVKYDIKDGVKRRLSVE